MPTTDPVRDGVAQSFIQAHEADVIGCLHGFDRLRLQGTLRSLYHPPIMEYYLRRSKVLWKDFKSFATGLTERVRQSAAGLASQQERPMVYLPSSRTSKEGVAMDIAGRDRIQRGLVCILSCVEPCRTWFACGNRATKKLELKLHWGKCLHLYFYFRHETLGWLHLRLQTWFPFLLQVCLNGREWLAHQMDQAGIAYRRYDNSFPWIGDLSGAQALMDQQLCADWPALLKPLVEQCHPLHHEITRPIERDYYWTVAESEYATDIMFKERTALERIYPGLLRHSVLHLGCESVLRYLGRQRGAAVTDDVKTDHRRGPDGVRVKHWLNTNSIKLYDKDSILRSEVTINEPKDFRVWRAAETQPNGKMSWRILRRSVADIYRRAEVSRAGCQRHLEALAAVQGHSPLAEATAALCQPVRKEGRRHRALNPLGQADASLLAVVNRGEYALNGFRNRDIRLALHGKPGNRTQNRRQMGQVGRRLALLRAHGLITKVSRTHRYIVTAKGRKLIAILLAARQADVEKLASFAA